MILQSKADPQYEEKNFAYSSFAFAAVTGFCIGGTALANVIGIPYINKRLTLSHAVRIQYLIGIADYHSIFRGDRKCVLIQRHFKEDCGIYD